MWKMKTHLRVESLSFAKGLDDLEEGRGGEELPNRSSAHNKKDLDGRQSSYPNRIKRQGRSHLVAFPARSSSSAPLKTFNAKFST
jgi:hypothetical protein